MKWMKLTMLLVCLVILTMLITEKAYAVYEDGLCEPSDICEIDIDCDPEPEIDYEVRGQDTSWEECDGDPEFPCYCLDWEGQVDCSWLYKCYDHCKVKVFESASLTWVCTND